MFGSGRNDQNISSMQLMLDSLDCNVCSAIIDTENLKKFMLMDKYRSIAEMFSEYDISRNISEKQRLIHVWEPGLIPKGRNIVLMFLDEGEIQMFHVFLKCIRVLFFIDVEISVEQFIFFIFMDKSVKIFFCNFHNFLHI